MTDIRAFDDLTNDEKVELANDNHLWLNAFHCIRPSDDFLIEVGRSVLSKLKSADTCGSLGDEKIEAQRMTIMTVNMS